MSFWCGLMVLVFLLLTWAAGVLESRLFLFQTGCGNLIWAFNIDGWDYGFRLSRAIPLSPGPAPISSCSVIGERMPLPRPLAWERYEELGAQVTRAHIEHWFLIAVHLALWGGVMGWRSRRIAREHAAHALIGLPPAG